MPAPQVTQDNDPVLPWNQPAAQLTHALAPDAEARVPTEQPKHEEAPGLAWYMPAAQPTHPVAPSAAA